MNTNCLEHKRCPKCGHGDEIVVKVAMWVSLADNGTDPYADSTKHCGEVDYDDRSPARCPECGFEGILFNWETRNFRLREDMEYRTHTPYGYKAVIPKGTPVIPATKLPEPAYWAEPWEGMSDADESWMRNYGFMVLRNEVEPVEP